MKPMIIYRQLLIFGILGSILFCCGEEPPAPRRFTWEYEYVNEANRVIKVDQWCGKSKNSFTIKKGSSIVFTLEFPRGLTITQKSPGPTLYSRKMCLLIRSKSVKIYFDKKKYLLFKNPFNSKDKINIFNVDNYSKVHEGDSRVSYRYTFTKNHYDNAQYCSEKCGEWW